MCDYLNRPATEVHSIESLKDCYICGKHKALQKLVMKMFEIRYIQISIYTSL